MKNILFAAATLFVIGALNWLVVQKERVLSSGRTVLLELAPRDPRSIMQGDYMVLAYAAARAAGPASASWTGYSRARRPRR